MIGPFLCRFLESLEILRSYKKGPIILPTNVQCTRENTESTKALYTLQPAVYTVGVSGQAAERHPAQRSTEMAAGVPGGPENVGFGGSDAPTDERLARVLVRSR